MYYAIQLNPSPRIAGANWVTVAVFACERIAHAVRDDRYNPEDSHVLVLGGDMPITLEMAFSDAYDGL